MIIDDEIILDAWLQMQPQNYRVFNGTSIGQL